jgi:hypothetical protein
MKKIFSNFVKILFIFILMNSLFSFFFTDFFKENQSYNIKDKDFNLQEGPKTASYIGWESRWYDYDKNSYNGKIKVRDTDVYNSILYKEKIPADTWGEFYRGMYLYDKSKLDLVYPMLDKIRKNNNLSKREFLDVIVSFVQDIEYNIVSMEDCKTAYKNNNTVYELINDGVDCDGEIYAGVYSPLEFMAKFKGDCDSRTVFLYTVLKRYNYDVVILNSDLYVHSIIGVNISSSGRYKYHQGKRYYTWETTNIGWRLGMLPPENSNINYWHVAL